MNCCNNSQTQKAIIIARGNDTDFNDIDFLTIYLHTEILDLSTFKAVFKLGNITKLFDDISSGKIILNFTGAETARLLPECWGTLNLIDTQGRIATIENRIPFQVVSVIDGNAIVNEPYTLNFDVKQQGETILNISVESAVSVQVGTTTTLPSGSNATVTNVGTDNHLILNFGIPKGADGDGGRWGDIGGDIQDQVDLQQELNSISGGLSDNIQYVDNKINTHIADTTNPHEVTKAQIGLANVDNTSDLNKPISTDTQNALDSLSGALTNEETARQNADNGLQNQIDALVVSSDVFDVVGTYAELQAYNISTVPVNDIIKVLVDSTHEGAATYYRCVETGGVKSWSYIGSEGAYYTKGEADGLFVPQTRTINGYALSNNISLTASDVGAVASIIEGLTNGTISVDGTDVPVHGLGSAAYTMSSDYATPSDISNMVTTDTAQDITGTKTYIGQKKIEFKQSAAADKLGFTCFDTSNNEIGAFEYRPNTISSGALFNINVSYASTSYVGFRYWGTAVNVVAPKVATAGTYYIPTHITNGNTTVAANNAGTVNINSLIPDEISDLTDVSISNPTQGQNLTYDATLGKWKNTSTSATMAWGGLTGDISDQTDLINLIDTKQDVLTDDNAGDNISIDSVNQKFSSLISVNRSIGSPTSQVTAFGNNMFINVTDSDSVYTSTDGFTWTSISHTGADFDEYNLYGLAYGDGKFVILVQDRVSTTTDGSTWTAKAQIADLYDCFGIAYGDGKFIVIGNRNGSSYYNVSTSTDGSTWTTPVEVSFDSTYYWQGLNYNNNNNKFIVYAVKWDSGTSTSTLYISTSTDGTTWTEPIAAFQTPLQMSSGTYMSYSGDKFVFIAAIYNSLTSSTEYYMSTSEDGTTWTTLTLVDELSNVNSVISDGRKCYFYLSNSVAKTFQVFDENIPQISAIVDQTFDASSKRAQSGVAIANMNFATKGDLTQKQTKITSINAGTNITIIPEKDWTVASVNFPTSKNWYCVASDGSKFVTISSTGYVSTSTDGSTWTAATFVSNLNSRDWYGLTYDGTQFIALGGGGYISTSTDGTTWTAATQVTNLGNKNWYNIVYDGTQYLALSQNGYVSTSTDGSSWTAAAAPTGFLYKSWYNLAYGNGKYVAITNYNYVSTSTDGINWSTPTQNTTLNSSDSKGNANHLIYTDQFILLYRYGYIATSEDGENWTKPVKEPNLQYSSSPNWQTIGNCKNKIVAIVQNGGYTSLKTLLLISCTL